MVEKTYDWLVPGGRGDRTRERKGRENTQTSTLKASIHSKTSMTQSLLGNKAGKHDLQRYFKYYCYAVQLVIQTRLNVEQ